LKYIILKSEYIQERDEEKVMFYKFRTNIKPKFYDKRLSNILDNLLLPYDEYNKLASNYTGPDGLMDYFIWIILFILLTNNTHNI
jgi:hypothetical protein